MMLFRAVKQTDAARLAELRRPGAAPEVQRALLLAFTAAELRTPAALANAERALLSMAYALPPADRQLLLDRCGGVADCACRLLSHVSG